MSEWRARRGGAVGEDDSWVLYHGGRFRGRIEPDRIRRPWVWSVVDKDGLRTGAYVTPYEAAKAHFGADAVRAIEMGLR